MNSDDVETVLHSYPQIYLACHVDHRTRQSSQAGITDREASFLTHIESGGSSPTALASHIGIGRSTMSEALARLEARGLIVTEPDANDKRRRIVRLTAEGRAAIREDSVLDSGRVAALLAQLTQEERAHAVEGLALLAEAARRYRKGSDS